MEMSANSKSLTITNSHVTRRELLTVTAVTTGGALIGGQLMPGVISPATAQGAGAAARQHERAACNQRRMNNDPPHPPILSRAD